MSLTAKDLAIERIASVSLLPRAAAKHVIWAPQWLRWLPLVAFVVIGGTLVAINVLIASDPLRVAGIAAEEAKRRGEKVSVAPGDINGYPLPYISDAASPFPEFYFWCAGLGTGSLLLGLMYLVLLPIYPATVQASGPLSADLGGARVAWRVACGLATLSWLLLIVVASTRVHVPGQDVAHRLSFGISFIILGCAAQPLLTWSGRKLHRAAPDGPAAWLTWLRAALTLLLLVAGHWMTYVFLTNGDYSTVEYVCVGAVIAFHVSVDFENRAVLRWLAEQRAPATVANERTNLVSK